MRVIAADPGQAARRTMGPIRIGVSGWDYEAW
jgi:hypothetical protein